MSDGSIQAFVSYVLFMVWPIEQMACVFAEMQQAVASAERIFSLEDAVLIFLTSRGPVIQGRCAGEIVFDHVDFGYEDGKPVLSDFSLTVKPGEMIAVGGTNGWGKSTIVNLLCRFFEPGAWPDYDRRHGLH